MYKNKYLICQEIYYVNEKNEILTASINKIRHGSNYFHRKPGEKTKQKVEYEANFNFNSLGGPLLKWGIYEKDMFGTKKEAKAEVRRRRLLELEALKKLLR